MKRFLFLGTILAPAALGSVSANATPYTYGFSDEYYVSTQAEFNTLFGSGTSGYTTAGLYQETRTTPTATVVQLTAGTLGFGNGKVSNLNMPGEFTQNDGGSGIVINGWTQFNFGTTNGAKAGSVVSNPAAISLQYKTGMTGALTGGTLTAFNLISMNLSAPGAATGYVVEGLLGGTGGTVEYQEQVCTNGNQYAVAPVNGTCGAYNQTATVPFNWSDIDTVEFGYESGGVFHTGWPSNGTLNMTNIVIDPTIAAVPEPMSIALLGLGIAGMGIMRRRGSSVAA